MKRTGECNRCGKCCEIRCPHLYYIANCDIKAGEVIDTLGINCSLMTGCKLHGTPYKADVAICGGRCVDFPVEPHFTPEGCGYKWQL